jgi:hypothetical protein
MKGTNMNNDYKQVYKNLHPTPRSLDEAFKTADYATPIWRCETDTQKGVRFFFEMLAGMLMVGLPLLVVYGLVLWLDGIK